MTLSLRCPNIFVDEAAALVKDIAKATVDFQAAGCFSSSSLVASPADPDKACDLLRQGWIVKQGMCIHP